MIAVGPCRRRAVLAVAAATIAIAASACIYFMTREPSFEIAPIGKDAQLALVDAHHAVLREGAARFEIARGTSIIETPLGSLHADDAELTVNVGREETVVKGKSALVVVTVAVTAGVAWWISSEAKDVRIGAGQALMRTGEPAHEVGPAALSMSDVETPPTTSERTSAPISTASARTPLDPLIRSPSGGFGIHGRVLDDASGAALAAAEVRFVVAREGLSALDAHGTSDAQGVFDCAAIEMSDQDFKRDIVDSFGHNPLALLRVEHEGYAPHVHWTRSKQEQAELEFTTSLDLGDLRLKRGMHVGGRVLFEDGRPLVGAELLLGEDGARQDDFPCDGARAIGRSVANGAMEIHERLLPGEIFENYVLLAVSEHGLGWAMLSVVQGRDAVDDLEIRLAPQATLNVRITDAQGGAIAGAHVYARPRFVPLGNSYGYHNPIFSFGRNEHVLAMFTATTDARGEAHFTHLPLVSEAPDYEVIAEHEGFISAQVEPVRLKPDMQELTLLEMHAQRLCAVAGRVTSVDGRPIAGAEVGVWGPAIGRIGGADIAPEFLSKQTDDEGRYRLTDLDASTAKIILRARAPGQVPAQRELVLSPTNDLENVDFVLESSVPIDGRLVDEHGDPVAKARLILHRGVEDPQHRSHASTSDAQGRFRFDDATAGEWSVWVSPPEPKERWLPFSETVVRGGDRDVALVLRHTQGRGARLDAEVVDAETHKPLDPLEVVLIYTGEKGAVGAGYQAKLVKSVGRVTSENIPAGEWRLWVLVAGRASSYADFSVNEGDTDVRFELQVGDPATIDGRIAFDDVASEKGLDVFGQIVSKNGTPGGWESGGRLFGLNHVADDGTFRIEGVVPGHWKLSFAGARTIGAVEVDVAPSSKTRVEIRARPCGHLLFVANAPAPDGHIEIELVRVGTNDSPDLRYELPNASRYDIDRPVEPGSYRWTVRFGADHMFNGPRLAAETQTGLVDVAAGDKRVIEVAVVPKRS